MAGAASRPALALQVVPCRAWMGRAERREVVVVVVTVTLWWRFGVASSGQMEFDSCGRAGRGGEGSCMIEGGA